MGENGTEIEFPQIAAGGESLFQSFTREERPNRNAAAGESPWRASAASDFPTPLQELVVSLSPEIQECDVNFGDFSKALFSYLPLNKFPCDKSSKSPGLTLHYGRLQSLDSAAQGSNSECEWDVCQHSTDGDPSHKYQERECAASYIPHCKLSERINSPAWFPWRPFP